jgi:hypothetical protein
MDGHWTNHGKQSDRRGFVLCYLLTNLLTTCFHPGVVVGILMSCGGFGVRVEPSGKSPMRGRVRSVGEPEAPAPAGAAPRHRLSEASDSAYPVP